MRKYSIVGAVLLLAGSASACAGSQAEQVKDARMEQAEARAEGPTQSAENSGAARDEAIEERHDAVSENVAAANAPGESATQDLVNVSEERLKYQSDAKTKLDKLGVRLDTARQKISVLGNRAPTALRGELATASTQYKALSDDVKTLDKTPAANWEAKTEQVEKRLSNLDSRLSDLDDKIGSV